MKRDYPGLDAIRFVAAIMVVFYHLAFWWWLPTVTDNALLWRQTSALHPFARWGWVGVQVFFVLSGFVIAASAEGRSARKFVRNRALRLLPAAWLCATITLLIARWGEPGALADYARSMILSPIGPWISGVYWTLAVEIVFYAYVGVALLLKQDLRRLAAILALIGTTYWFVRGANFLMKLDISFTAIDSSPVWPLTLIGTASFFAVGMLLWSISKGNAPKSDYFMLTISVVSGAVATFNQGRAMISEQGGSGAILPAIIWLVAVGLIAANVRWNNRISEKIGAFRAPLRTIGLMTYPLYLVHSEVGRDLALGIGAGLWGVAAAVVGMVTLSWLLVKAEYYPRYALSRAF